jgi:D-alanine-D-alanine ligase
MTRVAVLYGGISAEREVSLSTGMQVIPALREAGFEVTPIEVGEDIGAVIAALTPRPDAVFNALHGRFGEDGAIQGVLDWMAIPYTHSGVRASALAMDKVAAKALFAAAGLPIARGLVVPTDELEAADPMPLPYVVKPVREGSSVGVEIMRCGDNRRADVARAWRYGDAALVEEYIPGRELTVGVMGDRALAVTEIIADAGAFYDYESKYADGGSRHIIPAQVHPEMYDRALEVALAAHRALGCRGATRCDFRYDDTDGEPGRLVLLEINTASRRELLATLRVDGGERDMPRVARGPRNSVKDRPARLKLLLRRQKRLLRPAAWGVFGLTVVMIGVIAVHSAAPSGTLATLRERLGGATGFTGLRVTDVVIEGRANTPEPLLRAALSVNKGDPILGFSVEMARQRIESLSWVEQATVERQLPGTVVVNLKERRPFAVWQNQGKFALIDRNGQLVADQNVSEFRTLPLVVGVGAPAGAAVLIDALTDRPELQKRVVAAVRVGERRWNLRLTSGTDVMLPEEHEVAALDRLLQLQQQHELLDRPLAAIDMRLGDRLVLRPRADEKKPT